MAIESVLEAQGFDAGMEAFALLPIRFPFASVAFVQALEAGGLEHAALGAAHQGHGLLELLQLQAFELLQDRSPFPRARWPRPGGRHRQDRERRCDERQGGKGPGPGGPHRLVPYRLSRLVAVEGLAAPRKTDAQA